MQSTFSQLVWYRIIKNANSTEYFGFFVNIITLFDFQIKIVVSECGVILLWMLRVMVYSVLKVQNLCLG